MLDSKTCRYLAEHLILGLLIGGLFGFTQFVGLLDELSQLPVVSQFRYIGITWYSYALLGGISVALALVVFRVWTGLSNQQCPSWMWPPAASIAASLGFGVINIQTGEVLIVVFIFCIARNPDIQDGRNGRRVPYDSRLSGVRFTQRCRWPVNVARYA